MPYAHRIEDELPEAHASRETSPGVTPTPPPTARAACRKLSMISRPQLTEFCSKARKKPRNMIWLTISAIHSEASEFRRASLIPAQPSSINAKM